MSTVNKLQRDFWNAKQVLRKKLGKKDEECVIESDSDIDAKLDVSFNLYFYKKAIQQIVI